MSRILCAAVSAGLASAAWPAAGAASPSAADLDRLVGQPADIAPSAYQYRADRPAERNDPESWILVLRHAGVPMDRPGPADLSAPAVRQVIRALLWEEARQVRTVDVTWPAGRRPAVDEVALMYADGDMWWRMGTKKAQAADASADGRTHTFSVPQDTFGVLLCAVGTGGVPREAHGYAVPEVRAFGPDVWKTMGIEIEWGFEAARAARAYDGELSVYNGVLGGVRALAGDRGTTAGNGLSFRSTRQGEGRRGVQARLLYVGTSPWRKMWPNVPAAADLPRTIVTVPTTSGGFSFLAADLENGPILAPEHGFFVKATSRSEAPPREGPPALKPAPAPFERLGVVLSKLMNHADLNGWGTAQTPFVVANTSTSPVVALNNLSFAARSVAVHPGPDRDAAIAWRSPLAGPVAVAARVTGLQAGGDGTGWSLVRQTPKGQTVLATGAVDGVGTQSSADVKESKALGDVAVAEGESLVLAVNRRGSHSCDSTGVEFVIREKGGKERTWDLVRDVVGSIHAGNPHADSLGNADVWSFGSMASAESTALAAAPARHEPPFDMASGAGSAVEFIRELEAKGLKTIRRRTHEASEQTWDGAMAGRFGKREFPPSPPTQLAPPMQVSVPCERLTAQWNLGVWHNLRTAARTPKGEVRMADHPYAVLAQETFQMILAIDLAGMHKEAGQALDLWLDLPSKASRPVGFFTDNDGVLSDGGYDPPHAMGPGTIGWTLAEHYRLTGDKEWLKAKAPRMAANVQWILRQRKHLAALLPGGDRLRSRGLQPAHQLTPDAGGFFAQHYDSDGYYWLAVRSLADVMADIDPPFAAALSAEADAYRRDILTAVERSILLSPVIPVRDGTYRTFIPPVCHARGPISLGWMWKRKFSLNHWDGIAWDISMGGMGLVDPSQLLPLSDARVQGHMDVLEDRFLLENRKVSMRTPGFDAARDWFQAGWHHQCAYERNPQIHLANDDVPCFLRGMLNQYAAHIVPGPYTFNEHTTRGPPDKPFEEAGFMERFRHMLVREDGPSLWLARATPRAWLEPGKKIVVKNAPTHFGPVAYDILSDVDNGGIRATVEMPARKAPDSVLLRFRHPKAAPIRSVTVNGEEWKDFDPAKEVIRLKGRQGTVAVQARY